MNDGTIGATLLEIPLVPDPIADEELGSDTESLMADAEVAGSRLIITQRAVEPIDPQSGKGGVLGLGCTFHADEGARYTFAQIRVDLISPAGAIFTDIAPRQVSAKDAVTITVERNGTLSLGSDPLKTGLGAKREVECLVYPSLVEGSGSRTGWALWRMRENAYARDGIGLDHFLAMTVPEIGDYEARLTVTARVARSGLGRSRTPGGRWSDGPIKSHRAASASRFRRKGRTARCSDFATAELGVARARVPRCETALVPPPASC